MITYLAFYSSIAVNLQTLHKRTIWNLKTTDWNLFDVACDFGDFNNKHTIDDMDEHIEEHPLRLWP